MTKKRSKKREINSHKLLVIMFCAALVTAGLILLLFSLFAIYKAYDIKMAITVAGNSGFNTDTDFVNFGKAMPGSSSTRTLVMSHDYKKPLLVHFKKSGNISGLVSIPKDFYLEPGLAREVNINAFIPKSASKTYYEGKLTVYFRRI